MNEADYFEQFVGDDPMEYGKVVHRLVYAPTGQSIECEPGWGGHEALQKLWEAIGCPPMMRSELMSGIIARTYVNGNLVKEVHGW